MTMHSRFRDRFRAAGGALPDYVAAARLFFGDDAAVDAYLTALEGYAADGAEATDLLNAAIAAGTPSEAIAILEAGMLSTFAARAATILDGDTVTLILPDPDEAAPYLLDLAGTFAAGDWTGSGLSFLGGTAAGGFDGAGTVAILTTEAAPVQILGALTVHLVFTDTSPTNTVGYIASVSGAGETESANYLWSISATISYYEVFFERGGGSNQIARWARTVSADRSRTVLVSLTRDGSGRLRLYENGVLLTANFASGTGAGVGPGGAYVDLDPPTGGSQSTLYFTSDPSEPLPAATIKLLGLWSAEQNATKVLETAQTLGFA